jgi:hypothetical protein
VLAGQVPLGVAFGLGPVLMLAGGLLAYVGIRCFRGELVRNTQMGIRTPATLASDDAWLAGHRAAAPWLVAAAAGAVVPGCITLFRPSSSTMALSVMVGLGAMVGLVAVATAAAHAAAGARKDG